MKCPFCSYEESKVIDSRPTDEGERIRRRRECLKCGRRFTTYEIIENLPIIVIKKDKSRETFDREKLLNGLLRACEKRPVSLASLDKVIDERNIRLCLRRRHNVRHLAVIILTAENHIISIGKHLNGRRLACISRACNEIYIFKIVLQNIVLDFQAISPHFFIKV